MFELFSGKHYFNLVFNHNFAEIHLGCSGIKTVSPCANILCHKWARNQRLKGHKGYPFKPLSM